MALKDLVVPSKVIEFPGGSFTVRGLSFETVTALVSNYKTELAEAFDAAKSGEEIGSLMANTMQKAPNMVAYLIALAAGEVESQDNVKHLPITVQTDALIAIGTLTFGDMDGAVKFIGTLTDISGILNLVAANMPQNMIQNSTNG